MKASVHVNDLKVYFIIESIHAVLKQYIRDLPKKSTTHTKTKFHNKKKKQQQKNPDMLVCVLP